MVYNGSSGGSATIGLHFIEGAADFFRDVHWPPVFSPIVMKLGVEEQPLQNVLHAHQC